MNPYFCYCFGFILALVTYTLGWSDLYPPLTYPLVLFLSFSVIIFLIAGIVTMKSDTISFKRINTPTIIPVVVTIFIFILWTVEFIYAGGIPLLKILLKQPYDYRIFGVPSLHVFVVTFSSFYTIYLFHLYLSQKSKYILLLYLINLFAAILIYNRGMLFFNLGASASLYLTYQRSITKTQIAVATLSVIVLFFLFGVLGSIRVSREAKKPYTNEDFLQIGRASVSFRQSIIPGEFFWSYIYISSPLANLQNNIDTYSVKPVSPERFLQWFNNEVLPDFISKRVNAYADTTREPENNIPGPFNATSIYSRSYSYLGWAGMALMFFIFLLLPIVFFKLLPVDSPFFLTAIAILNTIFLFSVFDNTLRFTGLSFQLVYPILLHHAVLKLPGLKKFFVNNKVTIT